MVAFNREPGIFSRTRDGRRLEYWHADRPGAIGSGLIQWHDAAKQDGRFVFDITRVPDSDSVRLNGGPARSVAATADDLVRTIFLQK
jgi:hypothetical protein